MNKCINPFRKTKILCSIRLIFQDEYLIDHIQIEFPIVFLVFAVYR